IKNLTNMLANTNYSLQIMNELSRDVHLHSSNSSLEDALSCHSVLSSDYESNFVPVVYSIIFILGFTGNSLVVIIFCFFIGIKTVASVYILNLAVADLLFLTGLPLWAAYYAFGYNWLLGSVMCKICSSLLCLNLYASIFFITCMSVDRYLAVVHPLKSQRKRSQCQARWISFLVWGLACLASAPTFYFRDTFYIDNLKVTACIMDYPEDEYLQWSAGMALMKNTLGFLVPVTVMATCYIGIGRHLTGIEGFGNNKQKRDKVLKMVIAVVLAFLSCWLPFHILTFLDTLSRLKLITNCVVITVIDTAMSFAICAGFANSCINPILYCFVGNHFREQFHHLPRRGSTSLSSRRNSTTRHSSFSRKLSDTIEAVVHGSNR
uniref:Type-2 angiotensin II receptor n=2 Tax=Latimeria chalumnae TaxID=7897 RepID=H3AM23_LATCH